MDDNAPSPLDHGIFTRTWHYWAASALGLGLMLFCAFGEKLFIKAPWVHALLDFGTEVGIAVVVAVILSLTIERASHREIAKVAEREREKGEREFKALAQQEREKAERAVFDHVFGHHLPDAVRNEIIEQIFKSPFTRKNVTLNYHFDTLVYDGRTYLKLSISMQYEVHNTSPQPQEMPRIRHAIDGAPVPVLNEQVKVTHLEATGCEKPFRVADAELEMRPDGERMRFELPEQYSIKVLCERPTVIVIKYQSISQLEYGQKTFHWKHHVWGLNLNVHLRDELTQALTLSAISFGAPLEVSPRHDRAQGYYSWVTSRPILPGQGVEVQWKLAPERADADEQPAEPDHAHEAGKVGPIEKLVAVDVPTPADPQPRLGPPARIDPATIESVNGNDASPDAERT